MATTNPYLHFPGSCQQAFEFYAATLGGKIVAMFKAEGSPMEAEVPAEMRDKIIHARLLCGDSVLMGSDAIGEQYHQPQGFSINVNTATPAEAERVYRALAQGGRETMPLAETFWAQRFGMCTDRFGIPWMVNCEKPIG